MNNFLFRCMISFLFIFSLHAQEVIMGTPLSVEDEPGRLMKVGGGSEALEPVGAIVPAEAIINPEDGKIKIDPEMHSKEEKAIEKKAEQAGLPVPFMPMYERPFVPQKFLQFSFGYLDSRWEKVNSSLDNGSVLTAFKVVSDMNRHVQVGFAIEILNDTSEQMIPDNIRVLQYKIFAEYHRPLFQNRLDWIAGLGVSLGDYSIRLLTRNNQGEEVNTKIKSGTIYGVTPSAGIRFYLAERNSIDLTVEYHQYFSTPQRFISGLAFVPRFSFLF